MTNPLMLRSTGLLLASDGFAVRRFNKGEDFISYVASHDVPLVVLDIWMEEMTGFEVLARLCAISPRTHAIVITGHEDIAARILAMQIGTVAFLIKPFDGEQFLEVVHRALGHPDLRNKTAAGAGANTVQGIPNPDGPQSRVRLRSIRLRSTIQPNYRD